MPGPALLAAGVGPGGCVEAPRRTGAVDGAERYAIEELIGEGGMLAGAAALAGAGAVAAAGGDTSGAAGEDGESLTDGSWHSPSLRQADCR